MKPEKGRHVKKLLTLAASAAAVLSLALLATPAGAARLALGPPLHVISLHQSYARALIRTSAGQRSGIVPPRGVHLRRPAASAAAGCTEPACDLAYGGGPVQHTPHVYLLLWGPDWTTSSLAFADLYYLYEGLGVTPDDTWSPITSQYGDGTGQPTFGSSVFEGAWHDTTTPPDPVTPDDLAAEAAGFATEQGITDLTDAQIVVASQSGTCFSDGFAGSCGTPDSSGTYCGWHTYAVGGSLSGDLPFTNLPYQLDAGTYCGENWVNAGSAGTYDGFSTIAGHEYAETVTDPIFPTGWSDPADTISDGGEPGEVADKCAWGGSNWGKLGSDPYGDVTLSTGTFAMQSLWSNSTGGCVLTTTPRLTLSTPGTQKSTLGVPVSLQVRASTNTGRALAYQASGLPPGLSMSHSTGKITGRPSVTAGTFQTTVTVSDGTGTETASFAWQVSSRAGPVKGYASRCVDDYAGRTASGNKIDLWSCDGRARQQITFTAASELKVAGKCITSRRGDAVLETCSGSTVQTWTRRADGEYVTASRCLTDPRRSTRNGTRLILSACNDGVGQRWSLP
jgi:hypothetical protein